MRPDKNDTKVKTGFSRRSCWLVILMAALGISLWFLTGRTPPARMGKKPVVVAVTQPSKSSPVENTAAVVPSAATNAISLKPASRLPVPEFAWFQAHPFPASQTNGGFAWTTEDGKDTNVIRQLAHNDLEYQRMLAENSTIYRRQLVYHREGFTLQAQQAVQTGQSIQQLTLPGLDGQELSVTVTKTDLESGGDRGQIYGKLPDDPNSMVTVAFITDREAFTVVSPQNKIYLQGEAREPGEIIVKSIDPATYGGPGD